MAHLLLKMHYMTIGWEKTIQLCHKSFQWDGQKDQASLEMRCLNWVSNGEGNIRWSPILPQHAFPISQLLKQWGEEAQSFFKYVLSMMLIIFRFPLMLMPQNETPFQCDYTILSQIMIHYDKILWVFNHCHYASQ